MKSFQTALLGLLAVTLLAACGASAVPASPQPSVEADVSIGSGSMTFDTDRLTVPAGRPFTILYVNRTSMPHNVAIYRDASAGEKIFAGEVIGEQSIVYEVPAIPAGEYFFRCDVHPEMNGTVVSN